VPPLARLLSSVIALGVALWVAGGTAQSRSLQITGVAGYLSEWELKGEVTERTSPSGVEFFGPLVWKHTGLCSINGREEEPGEISIRTSRRGVAARIDATILFNGARCVYSGQLSGGSTGFMDCPDASGIPFSISIK
jgi:hypothetical protein